SRRVRLNDDGTLGEFVSQDDAATTGFYTHQALNDVRSHSVVAAGLGAAATDTQPEQLVPCNSNFWRNSSGPFGVRAARISRERPSFVPGDFLYIGHQELAFQVTRFTDGVPVRRRQAHQNPEH